MKILILAGHGAGDPGACSNYGVEATETRRVVKMVKAQFGAYEVSVDIYPMERNAYADVKNGQVQVNFANYDYVLEIHFNSSANSSANGTEVWVTNSENGTTVEQLIVNKIASLGFLNRGVKREDFAVIKSAKNKGVSAALIETCFISNQEDMNRYNNNFSKVCNAIVEGVAEGFGLKKTGSYAEPTPQPVAPTEKPKVNYFVKTTNGKQLGAFGSLENAKNMASKNKAIVYDKNGKVVVSYVPTVSNTKYVNLKAHMTSWRVYKESSVVKVGNECGYLNPSLGKSSGGLTYTVVKEWGNDVYSIKTSSFGQVKIYCPNDNDGCVSINKLYEFVN